MRKVLEPVNDLFKHAINYCTYLPIRQASRLDHVVADEIHRMARERAVQNEGQDVFRQRRNVASQLLSEFEFRLRCMPNTWKSRYVDV